MAKKNIDALRQTALSFHQKAMAISDAAEAEGREMSQEEVIEVSNLTTQFDNLQAQVTTLEKLEAQAAMLNGGQGRRTAPAPTGAPARVATVGNNANVLNAIVAAMPRGLHAVQAAAGDLFRESQSADGGILLPVDKRALISLLAPPDLIHGRCDITTTTSNAASLPIDADADWSADLAAADVAEGATVDEGKVAFGSVDAVLGKSMVIARVTREMLEDNTGIGEYVLNKLARKLAWKLHAKAITAFLASGGKVTVAKSAGAAAGSAPTLSNIQSMLTSLLTANRMAGVFLANPSLEPLLGNITIGNMPVYLPMGSIANEPYGKLYGRPIVFVDGLPAVGTTGDLAFVDPSTFWGVLKSVGPRVDMSTEAEFKNDIVVYKGSVRSHFVSKWSATVERPDGTDAGNIALVATRA